MYNYHIRKKNYTTHRFIICIVTKMNTSNKNRQTKTTINEGDQEKIIKEI